MKPLLVQYSIIANAINCNKGDNTEIEINIIAKIIDWCYRQFEGSFYRHNKLSFIHDNFFLLPK